MELNDFINKMKSRLDENALNVEDTESPLIKQESERVG
jgi:hypothetical protein